MRRGAAEFIKKYKKGEYANPKYARKVMCHDQKKYTNLMFTGAIRIVGFLVIKREKICV